MLIFGSLTKVLRVHKYFCPHDLPGIDITVIFVGRIYFAFRAITDRAMIDNAFVDSLRNRGDDLNHWLLCFRVLVLGFKHCDVWERLVALAGWALSASCVFFESQVDLHSTTLPFLLY